ncbi:EAL domain-containing response regulator [Pseudomonas arsenicoxydans]|uniref:EAL domain-containing protein n=1 Tax=Pseudomonas arsenicoxydans TaxID=702115 RepID=A0A502I2D7_9PSED|nr:EAL domain-containing response regulator [Pseudomonas arsenicoxydans]TPG79608.1 EAL domain-containing protein [Pseudomonas arsenicoxydans]
MPTPPLRILVLENHCLQRSVAVSRLQQLGCEEVFCAADGRGALEVLRREGSVDVALCDLHTANMDGLNFLQEIARSGKVNAVILTSTLDPAVKRTIRQLVTLMGLQVLADISKPLSSELLKSILFQHMKNRNAELPLLTSEPVITQQDVHKALENQEFEAYFQPKFDLNSGAIQSAEVLARWIHPTLGALSPAIFLPTIKHLGLIDRLLDALLHQGLALQHKAHEQGYSLNVAFNLEASQLADRDFWARIKALLATQKAHGSGLTFELTERSTLEMSSTTLENLVRLRMLGCRLSIDDFGSGYSSLQRLYQLPFNEIKLDSEFVRALKDEPHRQAAITSTLTLGKALGMSVVIEGVETEEQRQMLIELGCSMGQGYLCARPMPAYDFLALLRKKKQECSHLSFAL